MDGKTMFAESIELYANEFCGVKMRIIILYGEQNFKKFFVHLHDRPI